jgi:hypothetical protein
MKKLSATAVGCLLTFFSLGQVSLTTTSISQNFDGMGSSATATLPTGFRVNTTANFSTGTTATTQAAGTTGTGVLTGSSAGAIYNFANGITGSSTDRAVGFLTSGTFSSPRSILFAFTNNTSGLIDNLTISWDFEKYRSGTRAFDWTFFHGANATSVSIAASAGNQSYAADANNTTIFNPPSATNRSVSLTGLSIANGTTYYLCWTYTGVGGATNAQGLGVDNFALSFVPTTPTTTSIAPASATAGGVGFTLTVNGTNFYSGISTVQWNGSPRSTTFVSNTELTATISAADIASSGTASVTVLNTGNATASNAQTFTINPATGPPTLVTNTTTAIGSTTATGNGTITADGGSTVTERGVAYDLFANPDPDIADPRFSETGSFGTGAYSGSLSPLSPATRYKARAYATNGTGTGYGSAVDFYTLSTAPTGAPASLTLTALSGTSVQLDFPAASGVSAAGYALYRRTGSCPTTTGINNGAAPPAAPVVSTSLITNISSSSTTTFTDNTVAAGTNYCYLLLPYNWNGTEVATYHYFFSPITISSITTPNVPGVGTTVAASGITESTANSGGQTLTDGGSAITAKGVVWNTVSSPTLPGLGNTDEGSGTANFSSSLSSLSPQTQYFVRAYATNLAGTGYGPNINFRTLSNPPTVQATGLTATAQRRDTIVLNWTAATFPVSGATNRNYLLLRAISPNTPTLTSTNGTSPTVDVNTTIVSSSIAQATTTFTNFGLAQATTYNYLLIPYTWDGTNPATYHYLTASAPSASATTPSFSSDIVSAGGESVSISSLENDPTITTTADGAQVWAFTIRDGGGSPDADALPTIVQDLIFTQTAGNAIDQWADAIRAIGLFEGSTLISNTATITSNQIRFLGVDLNIPDDANRTFTLRISLNDNVNTACCVGNGNLDGDDFGFNLTVGNQRIGTGTTSSGFTGSGSVGSTNGQNVYQVLATELRIVQQPTTVLTFTNISPAVTLQATDIHGNRDQGYATAVSITATGATLVGSPVNSTPVLGLATFSTLQFSTTGLGVTLSATSGTFSAVISSTFDVNPGPASYKYRSIASGNWSDISPPVWERALRESESYTSVTLVGDLPTSANDSIFIRAGHAITSNANRSVDQLTVFADGQLNLTANTFTVANGAGTDVEQYGTIRRESTATLSFSASATMICRNGSLFQLSSTGASPDATATSWETNSTLEFTGNQVSNPGFSPSEVYGNVWWNPTSQSMTLNAVGNLTALNGNLIISGTPANILRLVGNAVLNLRIGKSLRLSSGLVEFSNNGASSGGSIQIGDSLEINLGAGSFSGIAANPISIIFTGDSSHFRLNSGTLTNTNINWSVPDTASLTLHSNLPVASGRSLTVNGVLHAGIHQITGAGAETINGTVYTSNTNGFSGSSTTTINDNGGTTTLATTSTIVYNASGAQAITNDLSYGNLQLAGSGLKTPNGNLTMRNLSLTGSAVLVGTSRTFTLSGDWSNYSTTGFQEDRSTVVFSASGDQNLNISSTDGEDFHNLTFSGTGTKSILPAGTPAASVRIRPAGVLSANNVTLNLNNDSLILRSDADSTARLAAVTGTLTVLNDSRFTVQRNAPADVRGFRFLSSPVIGATFSQWQQHTHITGPGGAVNGFDPTTTNAASCFYYDEVVPGLNFLGFTSIPNTSSTIEEGRGYRILIRGDRTINLSQNNATQSLANNSALLRVSGSPRIATSAISLPVSYSATSSLANDGWNLVGNPLPSPIDWDASSGWVKTNLDNAIYVWRTAVGAYYSWVGGTTTPASILNPTIINSGEAFFVKANNTAPVLTLTESVKSTLNPNVNFKSAQQSSPTQWVKFSTPNDSLSDEMAFKIEPNASFAFDGSWDAFKYGNPSININSWLGSQAYAINSFPPIFDTLMLPLRVSSVVQGPYVLSFRNRVGDWSGYSVSLVDRFLSSVHVVDTSFQHTFSITADTASFGTNRFYLRIQNLNFTTGAPTTLPMESMVSVVPNPIKDGLLRIRASLLPAGNAELTLLNSKGNIVWQGNWESGDTSTFNLSALPSGLYVLRVMHPAYKGMLKVVIP